MIDLDTVWLAVLLTFLAFAAGCGTDARADAPDDLSVAFQEVTDSTVVATATWSGNADVFPWRVVDGPSGEVDSLSVSTEVARADSVTTREFCVAGVNERDGQRGDPSPEACATFSVPPTPIPTPDQPSIDSIEVDTTTEVSQVPWDTLRPYDLETGTFASADTLAPGELGATLTVIGEIDGAQYVCATVEGRGQGWWELASTSGGLTLKQETTVFWDDRTHCGVEVDVSPSEPVRLVDASLDTLTEDADPSLVMDQTPEQRRACVAQGVCKGGS